MFRKLLVLISGLALLFLSGCATKNFRAYEGNPLPKTEVAQIKIESQEHGSLLFPRTSKTIILGVDNEVMDGAPHNFIEAKPGKYILNTTYYYAINNGFAGGMINRNAASQYMKWLPIEIQAGHDYQVKFKEHIFEGAMGLDTVEDVDIWLEDTATGDIFGAKEGKALLSGNFFHFNQASGDKKGTLEIVVKRSLESRRTRCFVRADNGPVRPFSNVAGATIELDEGEHSVILAHYFRQNAQVAFEESADNMAKVKIEAGKVTRIVYEEALAIFSSGEITSVETE